MTNSNRRRRPIKVGDSLGSLSPTDRQMLLLAPGLEPIPADVAGPLGAVYRATLEGSQGKPKVVNWYNENQELIGTTYHR